MWFDQPHRPTRDIDSLGFGPSELDDLIEVFRQVCVQSSDEVIVFDQGSVQAARIRKEANYECVRVTLLGTLDCVRCSVQIDVRYGMPLRLQQNSSSFQRCLMMLLRRRCAPIPCTP
nr:nucleotidyl transferase AbiEii/AbiGii toxin family protein [Massilia oculi]